jgi:hypothetical protein
MCRDFILSGYTSVISHQFLQSCEPKSMQIIKLSGGRTKNHANL